MSLPEAPEGYSFRIEKAKGEECVFVKLIQRRLGNRGLNDYLVSEIPVSTSTVRTGRFDGAGDLVFINDVERAAKTLLNRLERDIMVKELVEETWPQS